MSDITKSNSQKKNQIPQTKNDTKTTNYSYIPRIRSGYIMLIPAISLVLAGFLLPKNNAGSDASAHDLSMSELKDIKAAINGQVVEIDPSSSKDIPSNTEDEPKGSITDKSNTEFNIKQNNSSSSVRIKSSTTISSGTSDDEQAPETIIDSSVNVNGQQIHLPTEERFNEKYETEDSQVRLRGENNNGSSSIDISIDSN